MLLEEHFSIEYTSPNNKESVLFSKHLPAVVYDLHR